MIFRYRRATNICFAVLCLALYTKVTPLLAMTIIIDDFTEVSDPSPYPLTQTLLTPVNSSDELGLASTLGGARVVVLLPSSSVIPAPNPSTVSITANVQGGAFTAAASVESEFSILLAWGSDDLNQPLNFDTTPYKTLVFEYSATDDVMTTITLANADTPGSSLPTASLGLNFTLPAAVNGILEIPLVDINTPVADVLNTPVGGPTVFFPPLDPTSLDTIVLGLRTPALGTLLTMTQVSFAVPEPSSAALLLLGGVVAWGYRPRRQS